MAANGKKGLKYVNWDDLKDMTPPKRKRAFVAWLMKLDVSRNEARLICHRKFYHGDPFGEPNQKERSRYGRE